MSGNEFSVGPYDVDRDESRRNPRGHRIGDQRVEDLPSREEVGE